MNLDMIVCGAAGQGVVTLARVYTVAALREGFEAKSVAWFGIAKTEGPVWAHVRIGHQVGPSPKIRRGAARAMVAMDALEALKHAHYLSEGALVLLDETGMPPVFSRFGPAGYPDTHEVQNGLAGMNVKWVPTLALALKAGSTRLCGAVMLGALAGAVGKVDRDQLVMALREELPEMADMEAEAFYLGYGFITGKDI